MKIRIERKGNKGESPTLSVFLDGEKAALDFSLSRVFTNTRSETGNGIFDSDVVDFSRNGGSKVSVDFAPFDFYDNKSVAAIRDEIINRVEAVNRAFNEKYPAVSEVLEFDI